jgi:hypothetical protein
MWLPVYKKFTEDIDIEKEFERFLKRGAFYHPGRLPCAFHGIVSRAALDKVYHRAGSFCPGMSLDSANFTALSLVVKKHVFVGIPYTVGGMCGASTFGGGNITHPSKGEFGGVKGLDSNIKENWEEKIPMAWTTHGVATHATIQAIRAMGREDVLKRLNYNYFYGIFIALDPQLISLVCPLVKGVKNKLLVLLYTISGIRIRAAFFISRFICWRLHINIGGEFIPSHNVPTIREAIALLDTRIPDA